MKGKYLVILLLIITFICAFCKYSRNVQVRELFIDDKEVKELFNTGTKSESKLDELQLEDFPDIVSCENLDDTNDTSNSVTTQLTSLYNILDKSIIDYYKDAISEMKGSFDRDIETIQNTYNTIFKSDNNNITTLINADILSPVEGNNICDTHIKPRAENNELVSQINVVLNNDNWNTLINDITKANSDLETEKEGLENEITKSESFFDKNVISPLIGGISSKTEDGKVIYTADDASSSHFGTLLNAIKDTNDMINNTKYIEDLNKYKGQFEVLKESLERKKVSNYAKIRQIDAVFLADNFQKEATSPLFQGATRNDDSIKRHCNINGKMAGSGICYDNPTYQGCFIDCKLTDGTGSCASSSDIGYTNPAVYTNVFGSSINIHKHSHKHPGSHPHRESILNTIEQTQTLQTPAQAPSPIIVTIPTPQS